jgi:Endoribonuclease L-PSP
LKDGEMKVSRERYQHGSVRKIPHSQGFAREFRFYLTTPDGKRKLTALLASEESTWHDIVRAACHLRDIDRDYEAFNEERTAFYKEQGLDPLPASTGIQAHLCRPESLVEIEAIAMFLTGENSN